MRSTDTPERGPVLGPAIKPAAPPPAPDPAKGFELGNWGSTLPEGLAEKPADPAPADPIVSAGRAEDWEGLCLDPYTAAILGCI